MNIINPEEAALMERLKTELADSVAISDIEMFAWTEDGYWWDIEMDGADENQKAIVSKAVRYLALRGMVYYDLIVDGHVRLIK